MPKNEYFLHFHPKSGWINDPNGLHYSNGKYHMFYQYYPKDIIWGPMHWGHATSTDLINWEEKEVALEPDDLGYIFSGSAVVDKDNRSKLFDETTKPDERVILFYTNHLPNDNEELVEQMQSIAYLKDGKYVKYSKNPIIKSNGRKDFRDPKIFYFEKTDTYIMIVSCAQKANIYGSKNLIDWNLLSEFSYPFKYNHIWECPDLFEIDNKWILVGSMINNDKRIDSEVVYFVGSFDGEKFIFDENKYELLDNGLDYYAPQSWYNTSDENSKKIITTAWVNNWVYASKIPAENYRGIMTVPRELNIVNGKLIQKPVDFNNYIKETENLKENGNLSQNSYIKLENDGNFNLELFKENNESFKISYENKKLTVTRGKFGSYDFDECFTTEKSIDIEAKSLDILIDYNIIEIFVNNGEKTFTYLVYPNKYTYEITGNVKGKLFDINKK